MSLSDKVGIRRSGPERETEDRTIPIPLCLSGQKRGCRAVEAGALHQLRARLVLSTREDAKGETEGALGPRRCSLAPGSRSQPAVGKRARPRGAGAGRSPVIRQNVPNSPS